MGVVQRRVTCRRIDLQTFMAITATNAVELVGRHPRKGSIAVNMDADIDLRDSGLTRSVRNSDLHHAVDHAPYGVMFLTGWPVTIPMRDQVMMDAGTCPEEPGFGQLQPRETYPLMRPETNSRRRSTRANRR
jgi:dihydropyrimidinase